MKQVTNIFIDHMIPYIVLILIEKKQQSKQNANFLNYKTLP